MDYVLLECDGGEVQLFEDVEMVTMDGAIITLHGSKQGAIEYGGARPAFTSVVGIVNLALGQSIARVSEEVEEGE